MCQCVGPNLLEVQSFCPSRPAAGGNITPCPAVPEYFFGFFDPAADPKNYYPVARASNLYEYCTNNNVLSYRLCSLMFTVAAQLTPFVCLAI